MSYEDEAAYIHAYGPSECCHRHPETGEVCRKYTHHWDVSPHATVSGREWLTKGQDSALLRQSVDPTGA